MPAKSRSYFSVPYLCGAAMFSREAFKNETSSATNDASVLAHRAHVVLAITSSAAALEAMINEAFVDAAESDGGCIAAVSPQTRTKMAALWEIPRTSHHAILDKFNIAHLLIAGRVLEKSHHRWCRVLWVVRLRNDFVHFEPSWQHHDASGGPATPPPAKGYEKYEQGLKGLFDENRMCGTGNPFYPDRMLGHGCAEWSLRSALEFSDHFWKSIGVVPAYDSYRQFLTTR